MNISFSYTFLSMRGRWLIDNTYETERSCTARFMGYNLHTSLAN